MSLSELDMELMMPSSQAVWIDQGSCCIEEFARTVDVETHAASVPLADEIVSKIPVYDSEKIERSLDDAGKIRAYMAEWAQIFGHGAGIVAFRNAYSDLQIVDDVTGVLNAIIEEEEATSAGAGDHFATAGANSRVWNAHEKLCMADPELFARYNANALIPLVSRSWLGPLFQVTTQVNVVRPGGQAQTCHRDYHMGFQTCGELREYPAHIHPVSAALTLQGAIAHCDMPVESGPTKLLPYSQTYLPGYFAAHLPAFRDYFEEHYVQLPLSKGDAMFFNPATFHAAGENRTKDVHRIANLMQIGSGYGRSIEIVDRARMSKALYPRLLSLKQSGALSDRDIDNVVQATAEGYPFPVNLDIDSPLSGMAPPSQQDLLREALNEAWSTERFVDAIDAQTARKRSHEPTRSSL